MKSFCFTVDDNIRFFKEISNSGYDSIFDHPYLKMYKRLHEKYGLKIQLNLFYECEGFNLSMFSDKYKDEWEKASDWLRLSFHSRYEKVKPYEFSGYDEVFLDAKTVNSEILRFAGPTSLARSTTIHYCLLTEDGLRAAYDNTIRGLLGLYGKSHTPSVSYGLSNEEAKRVENGALVLSGSIFHAGIDIVLNLYSREEILRRLSALYERDCIKVMIHEQYFYSDYRAYQPDFEEKIGAAFKNLTDNGYKSIFFEQLFT